MRGGELTTYYCVATGDWDNAAIWATSSNGAAGVGITTPITSSIDVVFDSYSGDVAFGASAECASLTTGSWGGTLSQGSGAPLTVSGDIAWAAGTFTGGNSTIIGKTFSLTGGTWTSTSGAFEIGLPLTIQAHAVVVTPILTSGSFTFNHNSGTVSLNGQGRGNNTRNLSVGAAITFNNFYITGGSGLSVYYVCSYVLTGASNIIVTGLFKFKSDNQNPSESVDCHMVLHGSGGGIIEARGNVEVDDDSTWGSLGSSAATIKINGTTDQEYASPNGTGQFPHIEIDKASGTFEAASGTTSIGCTSLKIVAGTVDATGVTWRVGGSHMYLLNGNNPHANTREHLAYTGGTWTGGTIELDGQGRATNTRNINIASAFTVNNFTFTGGAGLSAGHFCLYVLTGAANLIVTGLLKFKEDNQHPLEPASCGWKVNASGGGIIEARGNLLVEGAETLAGTAAVTLSGTGDQTITQTAGEWPAGTWTNSNTAGVVLQATDVTLGGDLDIANNARWCMEGYDLTANAIDNTLGGTIYRHGAAPPSPDDPSYPALDQSHEDSGGITTSSFQPIESGAIYGAPGIASSLHSIETGIAT